MFEKFAGFDFENEWIFDNVEHLSPSSPDGLHAHLIEEGGNGKGSLYLGSFSAAIDTNFLKEKNIKCILTVGIQLSVDHNSLLISDRKAIDAIDIPSYNLKKHFEDCISFIETHINSGKNVLVHCRAGVSRSSTVVISYLIKTKGWSLAAAIEYVKSKRSCIQPNQGFMKQLEEYEKELSQAKNINNN